MTRRKKFGLKLLLVGFAVTGVQATANANKIDEIWFQVCSRVDAVENAGYMGPDRVDHAMTIAVNSAPGRLLFNHPLCVG